MVQISDPKTFVSYIMVEMPDYYHFFKEFGSSRYDISYFNLWTLYNFGRLDSLLIKTWTLFQAKEARRLNASIGFIDPCVINYFMIDQNKDTVAQFIVEAWSNYSDKDYILMPYNPPDHWVLIIIVVPWSQATYFDSLIRKPGYPDRDFRKIRAVIDDALVILKSKGKATRCKRGTTSWRIDSSSSVGNSRKVR